MIVEVLGAGEEVRLRKVNVLLTFFINLLNLLDPGNGNITYQKRGKDDHEYLYYIINTSFYIYISY